MTPAQREGFYLGQHPRGALIARIGAEPWTFYVGTGCRFVAPVAGKISLRINDTDQRSPARDGKVQVNLSETKPHWVNADGTAEVLARLDAADTFHITAAGVFWAHDGQFVRVGEHDGYYPTVINGIYWWPKWSEKLKSDVFPITDLWPPSASRFQLVKVEAKRGGVKVLNKSAEEIAIEFADDGFGSSQVGCVIAVGK